VAFTNASDLDLGRSHKNVILEDKHQKMDFQDQAHASLCLVPTITKIEWQEHRIYVGYDRIILVQILTSVVGAFAS